MEVCCGISRQHCGKSKKCWLLFPQCFQKLSFSGSLALPNYKILAMSKLKAFADNKFSVAKMMIFVLDWVENLLGKGENAGYQHFLLFP